MVLDVKKKNCKFLFGTNSAGNYKSKVNKRKTKSRCEICSKSTLKTPERRRSGVFIVNFEHFSHLDLAIALLTLST